MASSLPQQPSHALTIRPGHSNPFLQVYGQAGASIGNNKAIGAAQRKVATAAATTVRNHTKGVAEAARTYTKPTNGANIRLQITSAFDWSALPGNKANKYPKSYPEGSITVYGKVLSVQKAVKTPGGRELPKTHGVYLYTDVSVWWIPSVLTMPDSLFRDAQRVLIFLDKEARDIRKTAKAAGVARGQLTPDMTKVWSFMAEGKANLSSYAKKHFLPYCMPMNTPSFSPNGEHCKEESWAKNGWLKPLADTKALIAEAERLLLIPRVADLVACIMYSYAKAANGGAAPGCPRKPFFVPFNKDEIKFTHPKPTVNQGRIAENTLVDFFEVTRSVTIIPTDLVITNPGAGEMHIPMRPRFDVKGYRLYMQIYPSVLMTVRLANKDFAQELVTAARLFEDFKRTNPEAAEMITAAEQEEAEEELKAQIMASIANSGGGAAATNAVAPVPANDIKKKKKSKFVIPFKVFVMPLKDVTDLLSADSVIATSFVPMAPPDPTAKDANSKFDPWATQDGRILARVSFTGQQQYKKVIEYITIGENGEPVPVGPDAMVVVGGGGGDSSSSANTTTHYKIWLGRIRYLAGTVEIYENNGLETLPLEKTDRLAWKLLGPTFITNYIGLADLLLDPTKEGDILYNANLANRQMTPEEESFFLQKKKTDTETGEDYFYIDNHNEGDLNMAVSIATIGAVEYGYAARTSSLTYNLPEMIARLGFHVSYATVKSFLTKPGSTRPVCQQVTRSAEATAGVLNLSQSPLPSIITSTSPNAAADAERFYDFYLVYCVDEKVKIDRSLLEAMTPKDSEVIFKANTCGDYDEGVAILTKAGLQARWIGLQTLISTESAFAFAVPKNAAQVAQNLYEKLLAEYPDPTIVGNSSNGGDESTANTTPSSPSDPPTLPGNHIPIPNSEGKISEWTDDSSTGDATMTTTTPNSKKRKHGDRTPHLGMDEEMKAGAEKRSKLAIGNDDNSNGGWLEEPTDGTETDQFEASLASLVQ